MSTKKKQFKMYLTDDLVERLAEATIRTGASSSQEVVEEVLYYYLDVWVSVQEQTRQAVDKQTKDATVIRIL